MEKTKVMLADENKSYHCYINPKYKYWNGWLNPYFTEETKNKFIVDMINDLADNIFNQDKNKCAIHKKISDLMQVEFNYRVNFYEMESKDVLKYFFDFYNGEYKDTPFMQKCDEDKYFCEDTKNYIILILETENYEFINELYEIKEQNNLYYFGSCYCWIEDKEVK
jgi:hypothetical protein